MSYEAWEAIISLESENRLLWRELAALNARVEMLEGAPPEVCIPGNGIDEPNEWVPREEHARGEVDRG